MSGVIVLINLYSGVLLCWVPDIIGCYFVTWYLRLSLYWLPDILKCVFCMCWRVRAERDSRGNPASTVCLCLGGLEDILIPIVAQHLHHLVEKHAGADQHTYTLYE